MHLPYGEIDVKASSGGKNVSSRFSAFTDQDMDVDTGLMYYGARYYDPSLGQFTTADTIIPQSGRMSVNHNRYAYVNRNPIMYTDPSGHSVLSKFVKEASAVLSSASRSLAAAGTAIGLGLGAFDIAKDIAATQALVKVHSNLQTWWNDRDAGTKKAVVIVIVMIITAGVSSYAAGSMAASSGTATASATQLATAKAYGAMAGGFVQGYADAKIDGKGNGEAFQQGLLGAAIAYVSFDIASGGNMEKGFAGGPKGSINKHTLNLANTYNSMGYARAVAGGSNSEVLQAGFFTYLGGEAGADKELKSDVANKGVSWNTSSGNNYRVNYDNLVTLWDWL